MWSAEEELLETARGSMALERPNRFWWRYEEPYEQWLVADGERLWTYDVDLEQVTVAPIDDAAGASPALLLSGDAAVREHFAIVADFVRDGLEWVMLEPTFPGADFRSLSLGFAAGAPRRLEWVDGLNQTTRIALSAVELDAVLPEELFQFRPPPGADVIGADG